MKIRWLLVPVVLVGLTVPVAAQTLPVATPEAAAMSSQRLGRVGQVLRAEIEQGRLPGAVVAIARKGKLVYYESFGFLDKGAGTPMPKDAIFNIASMTKPLVAVGALMLYEEDRLLVNDPVGKYLPQLAKMPVAVLQTDGSGRTTITTEPARRQPTLQDLMRHTAGVTSGSNADELSRMYLSVEGDLTGPEYLDKLSKLPLQYQPGTTWGYSEGLDILALVVEAVTKQSLGQYLQESIFRPLGMADTGFVVSAHKASRYAKPLATNPETGSPQTSADRTKPAKRDCGGGCAVSTAMDYLRFAQMLLNRGTLDNTRILARKTVEYMTADHLGPEVNIDRLRQRDNINGYGFGLSVAVRRGNGVAGIMGSPGDYNWGGGSGTYFWVDPKEELAVVFMAAAPGALRLRYRQMITSLVLQAIAD